MNPSSQNNPDAIRSDIDVTRQRMDDTMNALGDRLQPQHLLDEVLGFFRSDGGNGDSRMTQVREKITSSADTAMHALTDTVKKNPIPALLVGAGVAWMIYESRRSKSSSQYSDSDDRSFDRSSRTALRDPDLYGDEPLDYPSPLSGDIDEGSSGSKFGEMADTLGDKASNLKDTIGDKANALKDQVKDSLATAGETVKNKVGSLRDRASSAGATVKEGTRKAYDKTRQQATTTVEHHPLEVGLAALAAGLVAGLILPTPDAVNRAVGPAADKLRDRAKEAGNEMLEKGKRVAESATSAVKEEVGAQGLTADNLKEKASAMVNRVTDATKESANREGLVPGSNNPPAAL